MRQALDREPFDYQVKRDNKQWIDHAARTNVTASLIAWLQPQSILDPACGDGSIVLLADRISSIGRIVFSDISRPNCVYLSGYGLPHVEVRCQSIEDALSSEEHFDVVVLTEVLEHLRDPDSVLQWATKRATYLIASSPQMREGQVDENPEHVWMFDGDGYLKMIRAAGWEPFHRTHMAFPTLMYDFQIWVCKART